MFMVEQVSSCIFVVAAPTAGKGGLWSLHSWVKWSLRSWLKYSTTKTSKYLPPKIIRAIYGIICTELQLLFAALFSLLQLPIASFLDY